jgi:ABC-2 type transport system ATP-binding protein
MDLLDNKGRWTCWTIEGWDYGSHFRAPEVGRGMPIAVEVRGLRKAYGDHIVLDGISFSVEGGTVLALLGPNGAGKTTAIDILTTRTAPGGGSAQILGLDVVRDRREVRRSIAVAQQDCTVDLFLSGRENLVTCARLLSYDRVRARKRADDLLERFDLADAATRRVAAYSGGMRRRLDLAMCLVGEPSVIFLDEPTTGLDPTSRDELWHVVKELVGAGTTIVLTTQYLEEADALADRIVLIADGSVVANGTPAQLKGQIGGSERLQVTLNEACQLGAARLILEDIGLKNVETDLAQCRLSARAPHGIDHLILIVASLRAAGVEVVDVSLRRPSLDEVFAVMTSSGPGPRSDPAAVHR